MTTKYKLTIGWLYPDLMSIYGDRGNIMALFHRAQLRDITVTVKPISLYAPLIDLKSSDILFMGGAQDRQQTIVAKDLESKKETLKEMIEGGVPGAYICGGYQFLGNYYKEADGTQIEQLGLLDFYTENPGEGEKRCVGNIVIESAKLTGESCLLVGFENHGGRTYLGKGLESLGKVVKGCGNNGRDGTEGLLYKNTIGSYFHGPILPKNPEVTDWLLTKALEKKYKSHIRLQPLDDSIEIQARTAIIKKVMK